MAKYILAIIFSLFAAAAIAQEEYPRTIATTELPKYTISVIEQEPGVKYLRFEGEIVPQMNFFFNTYLLTHDPQWIELSSQGGTLSAVYSTGRLIREWGIPVVIKRGEMCMSACGFLAMYSPDITIDGLIGLHHPYRLYYDREETLEDIYDDGKLITIGMITAFYDNGWPMFLYYSLVERTDSYTYMLFKDTEEFNSYRWSPDSGIPFTSENYPFFEQEVTDAPVAFSYAQSQQSDE